MVRGGRRGGSAAGFALSPQEARWQFPIQRFLTRRVFPKPVPTKGTDGESFCQEVVTGEVLEVPSGCMGATFVPFAMPGASVQIVHRASGIAIFQFPAAPPVGGGVKRHRGEECEE